MKKFFLLIFMLHFSMNHLFAQGKLTFERNVVNFGYVDKAEPLKTTFFFKNTGDLPLEISSVQLSTGKIRVEYTHGVLNPNETGSVNVIYYIQDAYAGRFKKSILVKTSDNSNIRLYISGDITDTPPAKQKRNDGYEWYRTFDNGKYGALDINEKMILQPEYNTLYYGLNSFIGIKGNMAYCFTTSGKSKLEIECDKFDVSSGEFRVERSNYVAIYDKNAKCIIPFDRQYLSIEKRYEEGFGSYYYTSTGKYYALCNQYGKEVLNFNDYFVPYYKKNRFVFVVKKKNDECESCVNWFIYDIKGKIITAYKANTDNPFVGIRIDDNGNIISFNGWAILLDGTEKGERILGNIENLTGASINPLEQ